MESFIKKVVTTVERLPEGIERAEATIKGRSLTELQFTPRYSARVYPRRLGRSSLQSLVQPMLLEGTGVVDRCVISFLRLRCARWRLLIAGHC